jgi:drug/metabolite transporter (DMT)-like permease
VDGFVGELASLGTAACWAGTAMFFASAGQRIGSLTVNLLRLVMALAMLTVFEAVVRGHALPTDATAFSWSWLSVSGVIGFTIGDLCLFRALVLIGPRLASLIMSLAPPLTALIGWLVLGETLGGRDLLGMTLTVGGIAWAVTDRTSPRVASVVPAAPVTWGGIALACVGALGQAGGLVLSKLGMGDYDPFAATQIRIIAGTVGFIVVFTVLGWWPRVVVGIRDRRAMTMTWLGAVFGPFIGVSLSLLAVQRAPAGVAASLMATSPVLVIPLVVVFRGESVGLGGIGGALLAVAGVALLMT